MIRAAAAGLTGLLAAALLAGPAQAAIALPQGTAGQKAALPGFALGGPVTLSADSLSYDENAGIVVAEGNVEVGFGTRTVRADRIRYDATTGEAEFMGHVRYQDAGDAFAFDRMVINIRTETGILYNGSIHLATNNYQLASERFEKTGPRTFVIRKGSLTTCPCDPEPDWKLMVGRSRVTIDGYAVAKDVTFKVRGVPVLWLPWAAFPVKLTRQSGLLLPSFLHSGTRGYVLSLPYYWAINRWSDATFTLDAMSRRGYRPEVEYRYVLNQASEGAARASVYHDRETRNTRYRFYGENVLQYAEDWTANAKWDVVSDNVYYRDLVDADLLRTARAVASSGFVASRSTHGSQALAVDWVQDHQGTPQDNVVQRLPEYSATVLQREIAKTGINAGGDFRAVYFYRDAGNRELRARGLVSLERPLTLYPSVALVPYVAADVLGSQTTSDWSGGAAPNAGRAVPFGGADLSATWRRAFDRTAGVRLVHTVAPSVGFRWIPDVDQGDIPVTDQWSRVRPQRQITASLMQRLTRIVPGRGPAEVAVLEVEWAYDFLKSAERISPYVDPLQPFVRTLRDQIDLEIGHQSKNVDAASDVYARLRLDPAPRWQVTGEALFDPLVGDFTTASVGVEWQRNKENRLRFSYGATRSLSEDVTGVLAFRPIRFLGFRGEGSYSIRNDRLSDGTITLTTYPRSDCWSVGIGYQRKSLPDETSVKVVFGLRGIGEFGK